MVFCPLPAPADLGPVQAGRRRPGAICRCGLLLALALACAAPAAARQLGFSADPLPARVDFRYRFDDAAAAVHDLVFTLPTAAIRNGYSQFAPYDPKQLAERVRRALTNYALQWRGGLAVTVTAEPGGYQLRYTISGNLPTARIRTELEQAATEAGNAYLQEHFLRLDGRTVMPDYGRIAKHYAPSLWPVARALESLASGPGQAPADTQARVALALAFIQSIPYDTITPDRRRFDFVTPPALLSQNRGDCDTKAVALASLLATLTPRLATLIVLVPGHALMAVGLPPRPGDRTLRFDGRVYVLIEPVGPAMAPVGRISERSAALIQAGKGMIALPAGP